MTNGLLSYAFFVIASRALGAEGAAPVAVLWSYWAVAAAVLTFPVQHWIIRGFTIDGHEGSIRRSLPVLSAAVGAVAVLTGIVAFVLRHQLFNDDAATFPCMISAVTIGSYVMGVVRGVLSGRRRYAETAVTLVGENAVRVAAGAVAMWGGGGSAAFGVAMILGPAVGLAWSRSLRLVRPDGDPVRGSPLALVTGMAGGSLTAQVVLTSAPVVVAGLGGAPAKVTSLFLALSVWRAPYLVAIGVTPQITAMFTRMVSDGRSGAVVRASRLTLVVVVAGSSVAFAIGASLLPHLLLLIFGVEINLSWIELAALGVGTVVALGNLVMLLILLALGRSRSSTAAWFVALAVSIAWLALSGMSPAPRVVIAFVASEITALLMLVLIIERVARQSDAVL